MFQNDGGTPPASVARGAISAASVVAGSPVSSTIAADSSAVFTWISFVHQHCSTAISVREKKFKDEDDRCKK